MLLCVPMFVLDRTLPNIFGTSSDIFGYYRTPTKNLGTLKIKNVTPINVKRLAGIHLELHCCYFERAAGLNREKLGAYKPEDDFKPGFEEKIRFLRFL